MRLGIPPRTATVGSRKEGSIAFLKESNKRLLIMLSLAALKTSPIRDFIAQANG
jgi:hypothetical protein